jgi:dTDP-4-dehydrorhamnose 3,5-epimerase
VVVVEFERDLKVERTGIPGLLLLDLSVHGDNRGWFKENWQRAKMTALGVPDLRVVQNNVSYNATRGVTRGLHAEPWDKFISIAAGEVFGAWVDLRPGDSFGRVVTARLDPSKAIYVPRGVANGFQALADGTAYTYLVDAHWSLEQKKSYTFVNLADPALGIGWPIPLEQCELSQADKNHPLLKDVVPMAPKKTLVTGAHGQLGRAIQQPGAGAGLQGFEFTDRDEFDIADPAAYEAYDWDMYGAIINAGAYTAVDRAETPEGRVAAWRANAQGPALLARVAAEHGLALVHVSSDYVFDGSREIHDEAEALSPYKRVWPVEGGGRSGGCMGAPRHYILRSSWVIGEGGNFVRTMAGLSDRVASPEDALDQVTVVDDQVGRLTFTRDMAQAILHLLDSGAAYGVYDLTGSGEPASWQQIARMVFDLRHGNGSKVLPVSTGTTTRTRKAPSPRAPRTAPWLWTRSKPLATRPRLARQPQPIPERPRCEPMITGPCV